MVWYGNITYCPYPKLDPDASAARYPSQTSTIPYHTIPYHTRERTVRCCALVLPLDTRHLILAIQNFKGMQQHTHVRAARGSDPLKISGAPSQTSTIPYHTLAARICCTFSPTSFSSVQCSGWWRSNARPTSTTPTHTAAAMGPFRATTRGFSRFAVVLQLQLVLLASLPAATADLPLATLAAKRPLLNCFKFVQIRSNLFTWKFLLHKRRRGQTLTLCGTPPKCSHDYREVVYRMVWLWCRQHSFNGYRYWSCLILSYHTKKSLHELHVFFFYVRM